jgi:hypothetical protein
MRPVMPSGNWARARSTEAGFREPTVTDAPAAAAARAMARPMPLVAPRSTMREVVVMGMSSA